MLCHSNLSPDDNDRCALVQRLPGFHRAFLIALLAVWRTHAGNDEIAVRSELPCGRYFLARLHTTAHSRAPRHFGQALHFPIRVPHTSFVLKILSITAVHSLHIDQLFSSPLARFPSLTHF